MTGMWCIRFGYKNCNRRLQAPIWVHSSPFQRDTAAAGPWRKCSCFTGGNHLSKKLKGKLLSSPKEGREPSANIRFMRSEQIHETVQFQNADTRRSYMLCGPRRLVHKHRFNKLFPYPNLSPSQKISQVRLPGRNEYLVLPFVLSLSLRVSLKCTEAAIGPLMEKGIRLATYIDNWLLATQSRRLRRC